MTRTDVRVRELSRATGVAPSHISRIFNSGTRKPSMDLIVKLADAMDLTASEVIDMIQMKGRRKQPIKAPTYRHYKPDW